MCKNGKHGLQEDRSAAVAGGPGIASARALVVAPDVDAALPGSGLVGGHSFAAPGCLRYRHCPGSSSCQ